jgi:NTE family protein
LAAAAAASAAFPLVFTPVTLRDYNHHPGSGRSARDRYVHLVDGGVTDNLGVSSVVRALRRTNSGWSVPRMIDQGKVDRVVIIVVDARARPERTWDRRATPPGDLAAVVAATDAMVDRCSTLWLERLQGRVAELQRDPRCGRAHFHLIEVGFRHIKDPARRQSFLDLPTTLSLPDDTVDALKEAGRELLAQSAPFQRLSRAIGLRGEARWAQRARL